MNALLAAVRRLATLPGLRRLTSLAPLLRLSFALRGMLVTEPLRFAANELRPGRALRSYTLRGSDVRVAVRHHTPDVLILDEVFAQAEYEPPKDAADALEALGRPIRVLDLGANIGLFGAWTLGRFRVHDIHGVEPDPANAAVHEAAIQANEGRVDWRLTRAFAAASAGEVRFHAGEFTTSHLARPGEDAISVPAVDVLPVLDEADLVKLDIEGAEWEILLDERFRSCKARAFVLEHHREGCPEDEPRELAERVLRDAGYNVESTGADTRFGTGLLWGWQN